MAVNRVWTNEAGEKKEEVTFVDVDIFGRTAENVGQYMKKGGSMMVEGRLKTDSWDDKQTGQKRSKLGVVAELVQFLGQREAASSPAPAAQPRNPITTAPNTPARNAESGPPEDDSVPF